MVLTKNFSALVEKLEWGERGFTRSGISVKDKDTGKILVRKVVRQRLNDFFLIIRWSVQEFCVNLVRNIDVCHRCIYFVQTYNKYFIWERKLFKLSLRR